MSEILCENCRVTLLNNGLSICDSCITDISTRQYYNLFLDDCRDPAGSIPCRNFETFTVLIYKCGLPASISFGSDNGTDSQNCVEWLVNHCIKSKKRLPKWSIHGNNARNSLEIVDVLKTFEKLFGGYCGTQSKSRGSTK